MSAFNRKLRNILNSDLTPSRKAREIEKFMQVRSDAATDAREHLHAKCDCVPDLGPAHCHLCGNKKGEPVPWPECLAVRAAAPEPEWEYSTQAGRGGGAR